jgi:hypothetical protein
MVRDLPAVIASQRVMLTRQGRGRDGADESTLSGVYSRWLREANSWIARQENVALLPCTYDQVLDAPLEAARQIATFLGCPFDCERAAAAVDPNLRHHGAREEIGTRR